MPTSLWRTYVGHVVEVDAEADHRRLVRHRVDARDGRGDGVGIGRRRPSGTRRPGSHPLGWSGVRRRAAARRARRTSWPSPTSCVDDVRADEAGAAGDEDAHQARTRGSRIVKLAPPSSLCDGQLARRAPRRSPWRSRGRGRHPRRSRRAGAVALERDVEDARQIVLGNAATGIPDRDVRVLGPLRRRRLPPRRPSRRSACAGSRSRAGCAARAAPRAPTPRARAADRRVGPRGCTPSRRRPAPSPRGRRRRDRRATPARSAAGARRPASGSARRGRRRARRDGRPPRASSGSTARPSPDRRRRRLRALRRSRAFPRAACADRATPTRRARAATPRASLATAAPRPAAPPWPRARSASSTSSAGIRAVRPGPGARCRRVADAAGGRDQCAPGRARCARPSTNAPTIATVAGREQHDDERGEIVVRDEHRPRRRVRARDDGDDSAARRAATICGCRSSGAASERDRDARRIDDDRAIVDSAGNRGELRSRRAGSRVPPVADAPHRHEVPRLGSDRPRPSRGSGARGPSRSRCRRRCNPTPASSSSSRRSAWRGRAARNAEQVELARREQSGADATRNASRAATSIESSPATISSRPADRRR